MEPSKEKEKEYQKKHKRKLLSEWRHFFSKSTRCEICERQLKFNSGDNKKSIHFDHKHGKNRIIKRSPTVWLKNNRRTPEKEAIWKSCDFGMLCSDCNILLPTENRIKWLKKALKYAEK